LVAGFPVESGTSCVRQSELSTPESKVRRSRWTKEQETQAIYLAGRGLGTEEIADCIGIRSGDAVRVKLQRLGVSLRNQVKYRHGRTVPVHLPRYAASRIYLAARQRGLTTAELIDRILKMVCQDRLIDPVLDDL
jgi:hypothetical protein